MGDLLRRMAMMQQAEPGDGRIYLYKDGNKRESVTGGWTDLDSHIEWQADNIFLTHSSTVKRAETVNSFACKKIGCEYYWTGGSGAYGLRLYIGSKQFPILMSSSAEDEVTVFESNVGNYSGVVTIGAYFGIWHIKKIWIEV